MATTFWWSGMQVDSLHDYKSLVFIGYYRYIRESRFITLIWPHLNMWLQCDYDYSSLNSQTDVKILQGLEIDNSNLQYKICNLWNIVHSDYLDMDFSLIYANSNVFIDSFTWLPECTIKYGKERNDKKCCYPLVPALSLYHIPKLSWLL